MQNAACSKHCDPSGAVADVFCHVQSYKVACRIFGSTSVSDQTASTTWAGIAQSVQRLATSWTGRRSNPGAGEIFRTRPDRRWGPPTSYTMGTGSFQGVKRPGRGVEHSLQYSSEVKESVELYLNSISGPS